MYVVIKFEEKKLTLAITESTKEAGFLGFGGTNHRSKKEISIQYNIQIHYYIGYVIQNRWFLLPMEMDKFCRRPSCLVNWALSASKVMPPELAFELTTVASWNKARVSSSTSPSSNFIPFSSMQARMTCCSSFSWIRPSPEMKKKETNIFNFHFPPSL